jgi:hypothetical protein
MPIEEEEENFNFSMFRPSSDHLQGIHIKYICIKHKVLMLLDGREAV